MIIYKMDDYELRQRISEVIRNKLSNNHEMPLLGNGSPYLGGCKECPLCGGSLYSDFLKEHKGQFKGDKPARKKAFEQYKIEHPKVPREKKAPKYPEELTRKTIMRQMKKKGIGKKEGWHEQEKVCANKYFNKLVNEYVEKYGERPREKREGRKPTEDQKILMKNGRIIRNQIIERAKELGGENIFGKGEEAKKNKKLIMKDFKNKMGELYEKMLYAEISEAEENKIIDEYVISKIGRRG